MRKKTVVSFLLLAVLIGACAGVQVKDPAKVALFTVNQEWVAVREYVIRGSYATPPEFSDDQVRSFRAMDDKFSLFYKLALAAYLSGTDNAAVFSGDLTELRNLLLEARRKYLPKGV